MLSLLCLQHDRWRLSTVNRDYSVCPSYPPAVIVPKDADDDMLKKVAKFRQGGRFPILCYYHRKNGVVRCFFLFFYMSLLLICSSYMQKTTTYFSGNHAQQSAADGSQ